MFIKYSDYISSDKWKKRKNDILDKRGRECEQCGYKHKIHVHHKTYENLGNEKDEDLQVLCFQCHMSKHDEYFEKYILVKPKKTKIVCKTKPKRNKNEVLLKRDFKSLKVSEKRKYLKLKGYSF